MFEVGQRIEVIGDIPGFSTTCIGKRGIIKGADQCNGNRPTDCFAVELDSYVGGHKCNGVCKDGHGLWINACSMKLIENNDEKEGNGMGFQVGDVVCGVGNYDGKVLEGYVGVIKKIGTSGRFAVEFDKDIDGHTCQGLCVDGYGYWVYERHLKPFDSETMKRNVIEVSSQVIVFNPGSHYHGLTGTVVCVVSSGEHGVDFGQDVYDGHNLSGKCTDGHGRYIEKRNLALITEGMDVEMVGKIKVGRRVKHRDRGWGMVTDINGAQRITVHFDETDDLNTIAVNLIVETEPHPFDTVKPLPGMRFLIRDKGWGLYHHAYYGDYAMVMETKDDRRYSDLNGECEPYRGYIAKERDVVDVDTTIDYNALMKKFVQTDSKQALIVDLNDTTSSIDNYKSRLFNALKRKAELEHKIKTYVERTYDFNALIESLMALDKVTEVSFDTQYGYLYVTTDTLYITATNGARYLGGRYKMRYSFENNDVRFQCLDGVNKRRSHWGTGCHHPHVSNRSDWGNPCLGNTSESIAILASERQYDVLVMMLIAFLEQANLDDCAGRHVMNWDKVDSEGHIILRGYMDKEEEEFRYDFDDHENDSLGRVTQYCECCDEHIECDEDDMYTVEGDTICENCYDERTRECEQCGERYYVDNMTWVECADGYVCNACFEEHYDTCEHCDSILPNEALENGHCENCIETCSHCGETIYGEYDVDDDGNILCHDCYNEQEETVETPQEEVVETQPHAEGERCPVCGEVKPLDYVNDKGQVVCKDCFSPFSF